MPDPKLNKYEVLSPLKYGGERFKAGDTVSMTAEHAAPLVQQEIVAECDNEETEEERLLAACREAYKADPNDAPNIKPLSEALGFKVSRTDRDAAWEQAKVEAKVSTTNNTD